MPIKGLTDKDARFPCLGKLRKGGPKREKTNKDGGTYQIFGEDLDYFRLDTEDTAIAEKFEKVYGKQPKQLDCFVVNENIDNCFFLEEWKASSLVRRCDGENQIMYLEENRYITTPKPCLQAEGKTCGCKQSGRLNLVLPTLGELGYFTLETHSKHDIIELSANLTAIQMTLGKLAGVPLIVQRQPKEISCPDPQDKSKRVRRVKWLLSIKVHPKRANQVMGMIEQQVFGSNQADLKALPEWVEGALEWATKEGIQRDDAEQLLLSSPFTGDDRADKTRFLNAVKEVKQRQLAPANIDF